MRFAKKVCPPPSIRVTTLDLNVWIIGVDLNSIGIYPAEGALLIVLERVDRPVCQRRLVSYCRARGKDSGRPAFCEHQRRRSACKGERMGYRT